MKTLYLECNMGAAGDMLMAALLELHENQEDFLCRLNHAGIPGVTINAKPSVKCGIHGTHMEVLANGEEESSEDITEHKCAHLSVHEHEKLHDSEHHHHNSLSDIEHLVQHLSVADEVKADVLSVYRLIAEAEGNVHGHSVSEVHFHEVGMLDAIADITGVCMLIRELKPDKIISSPVHVGSGNVRCAHGILPVPAPATAYLLNGIPVYGGNIKGELCTPTGAAILKYFVQDFTSMPLMSISKTGYGMGKKEFERANCVRAFLGEARNSCETNFAPIPREEVTELCCNLDDMTPEAVAFACELLLENGALDVYTIPIVMKKGRAGVKLCCMCQREDANRMAALMFRHTFTLGIRETISQRYVLDRMQEELHTGYGTVRVKKSFGYETEKVKPEYEDIKRIAKEQGISLAEALKLIKM